MAGREQLVPTRLGDYQILARLGTGGMAEVFLAKIEGAAGFTKYVAIKRMRPELSNHREFVDLFVEEARTASLLSHPNIVSIHELADLGGEYFMVMEYLEGVPLSSVMVRQIRQPGTFDVPFIVGVLEQACEGIHYAHDLADDHGNPYNIVHRDVSPPNLYVTVGGIVKLLDFGISKSRNSIVKTLTGQIRGKFSYMSPEQLRGEPLDRRSDVFSLGIVLFEMVTGCRLFKRKTRLEVFHAIVKQPIPSPSDFRSGLPTNLVAVVDRALARDRNERFDSALALARALRTVVADNPHLASTSRIGELVRDYFSSELESKRALLSNPAAAFAAPDLGDPTQNLRGASRPGRPGPDEYTVPDMFNPDDREFIDTSATTKAAARRDTAVDMPAVSPFDIDAGGTGEIDGDDDGDPSDVTEVSAQSMVPPGESGE